MLAEIISSPFVNIFLPRVIKTTNHRKKFNQQLQSTNKVPNLIPSYHCSKNSTEKMLFSKATIRGTLDTVPQLEIENNKLE